MVQLRWPLVSLCQPSGPGVRSPPRSTGIWGAPYALAALSYQDLTEEEIRALKENAAGPELISKGAKALSPKLTLFLGEIIKAAMVPDPNCSCKGKGCDECDVLQIAEELRSFSVLELGMAAIGASTASWKEIEDFFSRQTAQSGAGSSA
jgi:hypothetical protein